MCSSGRFVDFLILGYFEHEKLSKTGENVVFYLLEGLKYVCQIPFWSIRQKNQVQVSFMAATLELIQRESGTVLERPCKVLLNPSYSSCGICAVLAMSSLRPGSLNGLGQLTQAGLIFSDIPRRD